MTIYFDISNIEQFETMTMKSKLCIIDFHAHWCGPCKQLSPKLENAILTNKTIKDKTILCTKEMTIENIVMMPENIKNKIVFIKINIDEMPKLSEIFNIKYIPHIVVYKNGKLQESYFDGKQCDDLIKYIEKSI